MAYIGNQPTVGNFVKLDAIVTSATATYNLLNGGVAYTPASVLNMIVSLNGVIQEPTTASNVGGFTVSGSTIIFTSSLTSLDVIDFILVLGDVLNIGTPSDSTVSFAKVTSNLITGATAETTIAGGDSVLIFDDSASALRKMTRTNFVSGIGATAGQVIQVVSATDSTERATTSATFNDITGMTVSITPSSASNKVFIIASGASGVDGSGIAYYTILKDSTNLGDATDGMAISRGNSASSYPNVAMNYLDSPATTSATTYKLQFRSTSGTTNAFFNKDGCKGSITVMEIKG